MRKGYSYIVVIAVVEIEHHIDQGVEETWFEVEPLLTHLWSRGQVMG